MTALLRSPRRASEGLIFQIKKNETAISANSVVQTGPNTHAGGFQGGLHYSSRTNNQR